MSQSFDHTSDYSFVGRVCPSRIVQWPSESADQHIYFQTREADKNLYTRPFLDRDTILSDTRYAVPVDKKLALPLPQGCIFHKGRVGSTLMCNIIDQLPDYITLKEPGVVNQIASSSLNPVAKGNALFNVLGLLIAHAQGHTGCSRVVIKFTSWNLKYLSLYRQIYTGISFLYLDRCNSEVINSLKARPPGWLSQFRTDQELIKYLDQLTSIAKQYCNHMLDYQDFEKPRFNSWLFSYFRISPDPSLVEKIRIARKYHSKTGRPMP